MRAPAFREAREKASGILREHGGLGAVLVDLAPLARIGRSYGGATFQSVQEQIDPLVSEMLDRFRDGDVLTRDEWDADRLILFLGGRRAKDSPLKISDLGKLADRVEDFLTPRVRRLTLPYMRERPTLDVGYGFILFTPLETEERQISRLVEDAMASAALRRLLRERSQKEALTEIIFNRKLWTAFQEINDLETRAILGYEGLSRGPRGSDLEPPTILFGLASRHSLTEELERSCRRQAFLDWDRFGTPPERLFLNTVPATIRDSTFLGRGVLDYLGPKLSPKTVTLEINERQVIENLNLYREAMHSFQELGFSFAIDDVGAGYSGLETVATLGANYLKIDMSLVRDIHQKKVSQQVVRAILDMANGVGATVIAEGIQTEDERAMLMSIGIRYGQGYLYGRPHDPYATR